MSRALGAQAEVEKGTGKRSQTLTDGALTQAGDLIGVESASPGLDNLGLLGRP